MFIKDMFCGIDRAQRTGILGQMFRHMDGGMHGWHWILGILVVVVCLAGIAALIYFLTRHTQQSPDINSRKDETPLDTLKKRFAEGEITKEQFEEMKKDLRA